MSAKESQALWERAKKTLESAKLLLASDPDRSASSSYYAAFHAVSALFMLEGTTFRRHSGVEIAVHRDLVMTSRWTRELGQDYSSLLRARTQGDYGVVEHVSEEEAEDAINAAGRILEAVHQANPGIFSW
jgi:uncharacterized protein (UPF0332 family)